MKKIIHALVFVIPLVSLCQEQSFYFGHDLSYVNQMEDCGAVFKEKGVAKDVYRIFADHGTNLVRVRLWVDPSWWQSPLEQPDGVKPFYNDLEDVKETIQRAREAGMQVMLGIHYSDFWADPGRQLIPRCWLDIANDVEALKDSVYNYTHGILMRLDREGLMPDIVKVGNENNSGIMNHIAEEGDYNPVSTISNDWARHARLFNAAIKAVRDAGATASINPKISLHFGNELNGQVWNFQNMINHGITDFDIYGISYYYSWHRGSISLLEKTIHDLITGFPGYEVMVVETGYLWSIKNFDSLINIVIVPDPAYLPVIPEKQLEYMVDYTRAVMRAGGKGVIFWEPAWVTTPCRTPWGQGSSHDHLAFFDPYETNFMENGGGRWPERHFYKDLSGHKVIFKVDMSGQDSSNGVYITGSFTGDKWQLIRMADEGNDIYSYFTYLPVDSTGAYYFLNGNELDKRETIPAECSECRGTDRKFTVSDRDTVFAFQWGSCEPVKTGQGIKIKNKNQKSE
jgi:arabinogalactan endo-1,4-beta-galactosidase